MPQTTYQLMNRYNGPLGSLCVNATTANLPSSEALHLYTGKGCSAVEWTFFALASFPDRYHICTVYTGKKYCLDIVNHLESCPESCKQPHLSPPGDYSGQHWQLTRVRDYYKLSNDFTGDGWYLDNSNDDGAAVMDNDDSEAQQWQLKIAAQGGSTISGAVLATTTNVSTELHDFYNWDMADRYQIPSKDTATSNPSHSSSSGLSAGSKGRHRNRRRPVCSHGHNRQRCTTGFTEEARAT